MSNPPPEQNSRPSDGPVPDDPLKSSGIESGEASVELFAEDLVVGKETVETGRLKVRKETRTWEPTSAS
jgi:hypothetical protein